MRGGGGGGGDGLERFRSARAASRGSPVILYLGFERPGAAGGGLATYLAEVIRMHRDAEWPALVLVVDAEMPAGAERSVRDGPVEIVAWNPAGAAIFRDLGHWPAVSHCVAERIGALLRTGRRFDAIESCDGHALAYFALHRKLAGEPPFADQTFCITAHTPIALLDEWSGRPTHRLPEYWSAQMERFCLLAADHVVAPSRFLATELRAWGVARDDIEVIRNPYHLPEVVPPAPAAGPVGTREYLVASRVQHFKGIPELLAGFERYWLRGGGSRLVVAGSDTLSARYGRSLTAALAERYARWIDAGRLEFAGLLDAAGLAARRARAHALLHPSLKENFPYTVVEHMARGGVVAASANGGQAELIVDGRNGFLFDPHDAEAIAALVERLDSLSGARRAELGRAARTAVAESCDPQAIAARKQALYRRPAPARSAYPFIDGVGRVVPRAGGERAGLVSVVLVGGDAAARAATVASVAASSGLGAGVELVLVGEPGALQPEAAAMRIVAAPAGGAMAAWTAGVAAAAGEFVALVEGGDTLAPAALARCARVLERHRDVGYVATWSEEHAGRGRRRQRTGFDPQVPLQLVHDLSGGGVLVLRRQAWPGDEGEAELHPAFERWSLTLALLERGVRGVVLDASLLRRGPAGPRDGLAQVWPVEHERLLRRHAALVQRHALGAMLLVEQNRLAGPIASPTLAPPPGGAGAARVAKYRSPARQALSEIAAALRGWARSRRSRSD